MQVTDVRERGTEGREEGDEEEERLRKERGEERMKGKVESGRRYKD